MGMLTIDGNLSLNGNATLRLNKGGGTTSALIAQSGGTLALGSVGAALAIGDSFTIFAAGGTGNAPEGTPGRFLF